MNSDLAGVLGRLGLGSGIGSVFGRNGLVFFIGFDIGNEVAGGPAVVPNTGLEELPRVGKKMLECC